MGGHLPGAAVTQSWPGLLVALEPIAAPPYPDVPLAAGVPPVRRAPYAAADAVLLALADAALVASLFTGPRWGIFDEAGAPVIVGDAVTGVEYRREYRVSNYPVERGAFASYNKVVRPFDARVTFAKGGTEAERADFLGAVGAACLSLDLFSVVTPEFTYPSANLVHYDYRRETRGGAGMLTVEIGLVEVRVVGTAQFSKARTPGGADAVDGGTVQAQAVGVEGGTAAGGGVDVAGFE